MPATLLIIGWRFNLLTQGLNKHGCWLQTTNLNAISWKDTYMIIIAYLDIIPYTKRKLAVTTELQYFERCSAYCSPSTSRGA